MCEFCREHGEGKKWYLEMKNYSRALLDAELTQSQQDAIGAQSRREWNERFMNYFVMPAVPGIQVEPGHAFAGHPEWDDHRPSEEEILSAGKAEHFGQVLPIEDVEQVLAMVDSITRMPCGCRYKTIGKADRRYCFGFGLDRLGILGKYPSASASLEVMDKDEALKIFRKYDAEGLIHTIWTGATPYVVGLCNCDHDCGAYKGYIEMRGMPNFFRAEYVCAVDRDLCNGCKSCVSQCQFGAQFYSSSLEKVYIDPTRCFGCGVCRTSCPNEAISLLPRQSNPAAEDLWLNN